MDEHGPLKKYIYYIIITIIVLNIYICVCVLIYDDLPILKRVMFHRNVKLHDVVIYK